MALRWVSPLDFPHRSLGQEKLCSRHNSHILFQICDLYSSQVGPSTELDHIFDKACFLPSLGKITRAVKGRKCRNPGEPNIETVTGRIQRKWIADCLHYDSVPRAVDFHMTKSMGKSVKLTSRNWFRKVPIRSPEGREGGIDLWCYQEVLFSHFGCATA